MHIWAAPEAQGLRPDPACGTGVVMRPAFVAASGRWPRRFRPNGPWRRMRLREAFAPDGTSHLSARRGGSPPPRPDQPPAEPFVAGPADAVGTLAAAGGLLPRRQAEPSREVAGELEPTRIDCHGHGQRRERPAAGRPLTGSASCRAAKRRSNSASCASSCSTHRPRWASVALAARGTKSLPVVAQLVWGSRCQAFIAGTPVRCVALRSAAER